VSCKCWLAVLISLAAFTQSKTQSILDGDAFLGRWRDRSLSEFSFVLTETMPQDAPGSLTPKQYAEIISFILKNNGAPAGRMELPEDAESLGRIRFARTRGQR
jgi:hypothetical protein